MTRVLVALALVLAGATGAQPHGSAGSDPGPAQDSASSASQVSLPPPNTDWDYQLGGAVAPAASVAVVERDRTDQPAAGRYNICYLNAFQTQDSERSFWRDHPRRWRLVLKHRGKAVVDSGWGEWVLDTRTAKKRAALAAIVGGWIDGCAEAGYDGVELDNLDSFSRSKHEISRADNRSLARALIERGHAAGLAVAQKNWPELGNRGPRLGFDFAVAEECGQFHECASYRSAYGDEVLAVEYTDKGFAWACSHVGAHISVVRRDRNLTAKGVRAWC